MSDIAQGSRGYYPPPESKGGWRSVAEAPGPRADPRKLNEARLWNARLPVASSVVIIHRGALIAEWYENGATPDTTFNIHSCSKSFTGTAYGILFEEGRRGLLGPSHPDLDSPAYDYIPAGRPLTDPRKAGITLRHLLSMSSGIAGEDIGVYGVRVAAGVNHFAAALGRFPVLARDTGAEVWMSQLAAEPGGKWDYSDPAFAHLSLAFHNITGQELEAYLRARVFDPIGLESLTWDTMGLDDGAIGRHTMPMGGVHITARDLARFGYLMLSGGVWEGRELVPAWWVALAAQSSQTLCPEYGLTWWVNPRQHFWSSVPRDAFAAMGYNCNLCCMIPSLDVVAVRIGAGPTESTEVIAAPFLSAVVEAVGGA
jgi:CubicO group peptidase (beta-lactamase class C family)